MATTLASTTSSSFSALRLLVQTQSASTQGRFAVVAVRFMSSKVDDLKAKINSANQEVVKRLNSAELYLVDVAPAKEVIPNLKDKTVLIAGPAIPFKSRTEIQRGSVYGGILLEGWAKDAAEAERLIESGAIKVESSNDYSAVLPLGGTVTANFPVFVVENKTFGNKAFGRPAEMWEMWGNYDKLDNLKKWKDSAAPAMRKVLKTIPNGVYMNPLLQQALDMGDDNGNRQVALTTLLANEMAFAGLQANVSHKELLDCLGMLAAPSFGGGGPRAIIGVSMASAKAAVQPAENVEYSTVVTNMIRNGVNWGIQVSGLGNQLFLTAAPKAHVLNYHLNPKTKISYTYKDHDNDTGDSTIHETYGWGGLAINSASQRFLNLIGQVTPEQAHGVVSEMRLITTAESTKFHVPALNRREVQGVPLGIDIIKVIRTGIQPYINTGVANKHIGHAVIARGTLRAPRECFEQAIKAFADKHGVNWEELI